MISTVAHQLPHLFHKSDDDRSLAVLFGKALMYSITVNEYRKETYDVKLKRFEANGNGNYRLMVLFVPVIDVFWIMDHGRNNSL